MFIINDGQKVFGPLSFKEIQKMISDHKLSPQAKVCLNDQSLWINSLNDLMRFNPEKEFILISKLGKKLDQGLLIPFTKIVHELQEKKILREDILLYGDKPLSIHECPDFHPVYTALTLELSPQTKFKRAYKRVNYDPKVIWHNNLEIQHSKLRQLGGGGCFLETLKEPVGDTKLKIHVRPKDFDQVILVNAEIVAWLKNEGFALKFLDINTNLQEKIKSFTDLY